MNQFTPIINNRRNFVGGAANDSPFPSSITVSWCVFFLLFSNRQQIVTPERKLSEAGIVAK
jgi:hypothetical protein